MGQLIDLEPHRAERERAAGAQQEEVAPAVAASGRAGRVLLFTGVRYERMGAEPVRERAEA